MKKHNVRALIQPHQRYTNEGCLHIVAFEIFDLNNDGCIEREEMLRISIAVAKTMEEHGLTRRDFGDPNVIINNVFLRTSEDAGSTTPEYSRRVLRGVHRPLVADESDSATPVGEQYD